MSGETCGKRVPAREKGKVYKKLRQLYYMTLERRQEAELEMAELKMPRFSFCLTKVNSKKKNRTRVVLLGDKF